MTISHDLSPLSAIGLQTNTANQSAAASRGLPAMDNSIEFRLGPQHTSTQSMRRARGFVARVLPALFAGAPNAKAAGEETLAVLTELVDVTARYRASVDLGGRISCDGDDVLITVGEMDRPLPAPEDEPGLFLVRRLADDIGQYRSDEDGYVTWVSVPLRLRTR